MNSEPQIKTITGSMFSIYLCWAKISRYIVLSLFCFVQISTADEASVMNACQPHAFPGCCWQSQFWPKSGTKRENLGVEKVSEVLQHSADRRVGERNTFSLSVDPLILLIYTYSCEFADYMPYNNYIPYSEVSTTDYNEPHMNILCLVAPSFSFLKSAEVPDEVLAHAFLSMKSPELVKMKDSSAGGCRIEDMPESIRQVAELMTDAPLYRLMPVQRKGNDIYVLTWMKKLAEQSPAIVEINDAGLFIDGFQYIQFEVAPKSYSAQDGCLDFCLVQGGCCVQARCSFECIDSHGEVWRLGWLLLNQAQWEKSTSDTEDLERMLRKSYCNCGR